MDKSPLTIQVGGDVPHQVDTALFHFLFHSTRDSKNDKGLISVERNGKIQIGTQGPVKQSGSRQALDQC